MPSRGGCKQLRERNEEVEKDKQTRNKRGLHVRSGEKRSQRVVSGGSWVVPPRIEHYIYVAFFLAHKPGEVNIPEKTDGTHLSYGLDVLNMYFVLRSRQQGTDNLICSAWRQLASAKAYSY